MMTYYCSNCGSNYPDEQNRLIETKKKVFCLICGEEHKKKNYFCIKCGYPFPEEKDHMNFVKEKFSCQKCGEFYDLDQVDKKQTKQKGMDDTGIIKLSKYSFLPILLFSAFCLIQELVYKLFIAHIPQYVLSGSVFFYTGGVIISLYDIFYVNRRIKRKEYHDILLDSIVLGIIGSIIFLLGIIILIKGILIYKYVKKDLKTSNNNESTHQFKNYFQNSLIRVIPVVVVLMFLMQYFLWYAIFMFPQVIFSILLIPLIILLIISLMAINKKNKE